MKLLSSMELLTLFHKSNNSDVNLTAHEQKLLSVILCFANASQGYKAWPSTDTLVQRTGHSTATIERSRKTLVTKGWLKIVSGKGKGNSNQYFVQAEKIISVAALADAIASGNKVAVADIPEQKPRHKVNTSGLMQGNKAPEKKPEIVTPIPIEKQTPKINPDGSPPFHASGKECSSWADHEKARKRRIDEINSMEEPF